MINYSTDDMNSQFSSDSRYLSKPLTNANRYFLFRVPSAPRDPEAETPAGECSFVHPPLGQNVGRPALTLDIVPRAHV